MVLPHLSVDVYNECINLFVKAVMHERRIPFEIVDDSNPFYSEANIVRLKKT